MSTQDPGSYDPKDDVTKTAASKWGFGTEKRLREAKSSFSPGAGTYQLPSKMAEGPAFGMGIKLKDRTSVS